jgi:hypothetical protein
LGAQVQVEVRDRKRERHRLSNAHPLRYFLFDRPTHLVRLEEDAVGVEPLNPLAIASLYDTHDLRATLKQVACPRQIGGKLLGRCRPVGGVNN